MNYQRNRFTEMRQKKNKKKIEQMGNEYHHRLSYAIEVTGWKKSHLAKAVEITHPRIFQLIKGICKPRIPLSQKLAVTLRVPYLWLAYGEGEFETFPLDYPVEQFWTTLQNRLAYLLWNNKIKQLHFAQEFTAGAMWFEEARTIPKDSIQKLNDKFNCPDNFIQYGHTVSDIQQAL